VLLLPSAEVPVVDEPPFLDELGGRVGGVTGEQEVIAGLDAPCEAHEDHPERRAVVSGRDADAGGDGTGRNGSGSDGSGSDGSGSDQAATETRRHVGVGQEEGQVKRRRKWKGKKEVQR
jgi:hypothetical protein